MVRSRPPSPWLRPREHQPAGRIRRQQERRPHDGQCQEGRRRPRDDGRNQHRRRCQAVAVQERAGGPNPRREAGSNPAFEHPSGTRGTPLPGNGVPRSPTRRSSRCAAQRLAAPSPAGPSTVSVTCGSAFPRCLWDSLDLRYREHSERKRLQIEYLESFF